MPVSDVLKGFRKGGYPEKDDGDKEESSGARMIKLTEDEAKELQGYSKGEGTEQECLVTGRLNGSELSVTSVRNPGGSTMPDQDGMAEEMMAKMRGGPSPMTQNQTMPSPS